MERIGYQVEKAHARIVWIKGHPRSIQHDFWGCVDLIGTKSESIVFVQVKFGRHNLSPAIKKMEALKAPPGSKYIHIWNKGGHLPEVEQIL